MATQRNPVVMFTSETPYSGDLVMDRSLPTRRPILSLALGFIALALWTAVLPEAATAQSSRMRVLLPMPERVNDADDDFGEDLVKEMRRRIDRLATHAAVDDDDYEDALDEYNLDEDELNCIMSRQLAVQMNVPLVMCATYSELGRRQFEVAARFVNSRSGEAFEIETFEAAEPRQAADQIFASFERFVTLLGHETYCQDYLGSRVWNDALRNCNAALEINANSQTALYGRAQVYMHMGEEERERTGEVNAEAAEHFQQSLVEHQKLLGLNPTHQDALKSAGIVAARLERKDLARDYFGQYLELNPGDVQVRLSVATDLANAGDPAGALAIAEEGVTVDSSNLTLIEYIGHFALGAAQSLAGTQVQNASEEISAEAGELFGKALAAYRKVFAEKGAESDETMLRNMIAALRRLGRVDEAASLGGEIVRAKPESATLWSAYADALNAAERADEALAALDSVRARDAEYPNVAVRRGRILLRQDHLEEAKTAFETAIERMEVGSDAVARMMFAYGYNEKWQQGNGDGDAALEVFTVARPFAEMPHTTAMIDFFSGWILYKRGEQVQAPSNAESAERALPIFQRALEFFQRAGPYAETQSSIDLARIIANTEQYIQIQELLIKRGT